ncbi:MAG: RNA polymerase sigma factor [Acidimicrobiia bacterium]
MRVRPHGAPGFDPSHQCQEAHITNTGNTLAQVSDLAHTMSGVVQRDPQAIAEFYAVATPHVQRMACAALRSLGVRPEADRVHDIVGNVLVYLVEHAAAWRPEAGATPWLWARRRIRSEAARSVGQFAEPLDESHELAETSTSTPVDDVEPYWVMVKVSNTNPRVAAVYAALQANVSIRDMRIWLRVLDETALGNPSPSNVVALEFEMTPAAVRKVCQRVREKLPDLAGPPAPAVDAPASEVVDVSCSMARCS